MRSSRSAPARPARSPAREKLFEELGYADARRRRRAGAGKRPPAARALDRARRRRLRRRARAPQHHLRADAEPGRQRAGGRARAGGGAAQGPRAAFPAGARRRRAGRGAAAAAASRFRHRDGPHQRRDHLRRARAALRDRPGRRGARSSPRRCPPARSRDYGRPFAETFRAVQRRFLRDRPDAVQPGRGDRHRASRPARASAPGGSIPRCSTPRSA